jgi:acyl-CoA reductase-like NAD-dependent aldehyde dehydrogenase
MWVDRKHLFIGGDWVTPASDARIEVINATTEESLGSVPEALAGYQQLKSLYLRGSTG